MITTSELSELLEIINGNHGDPHRILGMHETQIGRKNGLTVRAFIPQAAGVTVVDAADPSKRYEMEKIHNDGFFEVVTTERKKWFLYKLEAEAFDGGTWTSFDPYCFTPVISEYDRYLFAKGTHYEIYKKLGAHPVRHQDTDGVLFAVWAPNARRVSVIGDFNSWDGRRHTMRMLAQSGIWELFVPGLAVNDRYKYEIKTAAGALLEKSDPYGNFAELRPSTSSLVCDITGYNWNDEQWLDGRAANDPLDGPMNIYEVHLGSWRRKGGDYGRFMSYTELAEELIPYVKDMGYTHIELMPIEEHPFDGSWGYQVTGYFAPTSRFGNPGEFMAFIDKCHQNGLGVFLDWVPAHFPKDAHGLGRFDGTALYEHEDPRKGEHPDWGTLIFNYGRDEVRNFLISNAIFWIKEYHLDGLRVDAVASMLYLDYGKNDGQWIPNKYGGHDNLEAVEFLKHMNSIINKTCPGALMIAEESTAWAGVSRPAEQNGLGFNLKWNMGWMNDFLSYISKEPIHRKYHHNNLTFGMVYAYTENFILVISHDEVVHGKGSFVNKMPGDLWQKLANVRVALAFMIGHPGKKLMFMGGEFGQFEEWNEAKGLNWFLLEYEHHQKTQNYVKALNKLYKEQEAVWRYDFEGKGFEWINCDDYERSVVAFIRKGERDGDILIFICNFTPEPIIDYRLGTPLAGEYIEIFNSDAEEFGGSGITNEGVLRSEAGECDRRPQSLAVKVPPLGAVVLKPKR